MTQVSEVLEWHGRTVVATDGDKLGKIEEIYFDQETNRPEWALIDTGMFAGKSSFMPLQGATSNGEQVTAPYSKDQVKDAPKINPDAAISQRRRGRALPPLRRRVRRVALGRAGCLRPARGANGEPGITEGHGAAEEASRLRKGGRRDAPERDNVVVEPDPTVNDDTPNRQ